MADILERICDAKRAHVAAAQRRVPWAAIEGQAALAPPVRGFLDALRRERTDSRFRLIAEIKKASPSKGLIRKDFDPVKLAEAYRDGGATCLSVLTDAPFFRGDDAHLRMARAAVALPILRKDFILDPYQVVEARALGADCILVIVAAVSDSQAAELITTAAGWGMDVLVEVHDGDELERALRLEAPLIGINNRNLKTLSVDLAVTEALAPRVPKDRLVVAESGLTTPQDLARMTAAGSKAFLVGESLMRQADVAGATRELSEPANAEV